LVSPLVLPLRNKIVTDPRFRRTDPPKGSRASSTRSSKVKHGLHLSEQVEADGPAVFRHACLLEVEGVVSKRKGSPYRSGRTLDWIKCKNPGSAAVEREAEEDWGW
jgi:hypothetical protein